MKILMYINIGHDPSAVRIVLKIKKYPVHLIHHSFFILMFHTQLIAVGFSDGAVLICPAVPDMAVKIMDIVGFLCRQIHKISSMALFNAVLLKVSAGNSLRRS